MGYYGFIFGGKLEDGRAGGAEGRYFLAGEDVMGLPVSGKGEVGGHASSLGVSDRLLGRAVRGRCLTGRDSILSRARGR